MHHCEPTSRSVLGEIRSTIRLMESDSELVARLRDGDELAFVMLVRQYQMPMLRLARSMVNNEAVAEEAVQDTWMSVVNGIDRFEARSSLKTWLFRILVNRVHSAHSSEQRRAPRRAPSVDPSFFDFWASGSNRLSPGTKTSTTGSSPIR